MRSLYELNPQRDTSHEVMQIYGGYGDDTCGVFNLPSNVDGVVLRIVASSDGGWDHVSVSRPDRCPAWEEMEQVKRAFFKDDETAFQLHVPPDDHINVHPFCLHLWRPTRQQIPMPPAWMVG